LVACPASVLKQWASELSFKENSIGLDGLQGE
jgi:hypothetical protein